MQIKHKINKKKFEPIELNITIESIEELETLWHRFNIGDGTVREESSARFGDKIILTDVDGVFNLIDSIAIDEGYKK